MKDIEKLCKFKNLSVDIQYPRFFSIGRLRTAFKNLSVDIQ